MEIANELRSHCTELGLMYRKHFRDRQEEKEGRKDTPYNPWERRKQKVDLKQSNLSRAFSM